MRKHFLKIIVWIFDEWGGTVSFERQKIIRYIFKDILSFAGPVRKSVKAGVIFPVSRFHRFLKRLNYSIRIGTGASIYVAAAIEYLSAEILELSGNAARDNNRRTIKPRHVMLAIRNDEELDKLLQHVTIAEGGVIPNIQSVLLPKK